MSGKRTARRMERTGKHRGASDGGPVPIPLNGYKIHNSWCVCLCTLWLGLTCYYPHLTVIYSYKKTKGENTMRTNFYLNGKKITRKAVKELVGEERLKEMLAEAKETFLEDPLTQNDFFIGNGMLTIEFA